jgi:hypothetical protein
MGKNWTNFSAIWVGQTGYIDLYDLRVGDYFMEDTYPDVYEVKSIVEKTRPDGAIDTVVETFNITDEVPCEWFYHRNYQAYAPVLVKLEPI